MKTEVPISSRSMLQYPFQFYKIKIRFYLQKLKLNEISYLHANNAKIRRRPLNFVPYT